MGRHMIVNPTTGRKVFKTGAIGRKVQKKQLTPIKKAAVANKPGPDKPKPKTSETTCEDMKLLKLEQFRSLATLLSISPNGSKGALITRISNNNGGGMLATLLKKTKQDLAAKPKPVLAKPKPDASLTYSTNSKKNAAASVTEKKAVPTSSLNPHAPAFVPSSL